MPADSTLPLRPQLSPKDSRLLSPAISPQQASSLAAQAPAPATTSARPRREAATKARKRVKDAYTLYPSKQDPDSDSDTTSIRPSAPRPTPMYAEDSSESDVFVDDSESDCPRPSKAALGKKRKRSASSMGDDGESRKSKAAKSLEMDRGRPKTDATGFMVKYGNVMRDCLMRKESRAPRESPKKLWVDTRASSQHPCVRRAGLSDMGPYAGSSVSSCRTEV